MAKADASKKDVVEQLRMRQVLRGPCPVLGDGILGEVCDPVDHHEPNLALVGEAEEIFGGNPELSRRLGSSKRLT